ncbi:hypothetical protein FV232_24745 [Methylobacterium sp. WL30]|uniref:hypothetical protein n=1 Tax=unclassified Methylobacterium TaxID=2615210 RepID=UPI0011CB1DBB|nr:MULTISPECIES: hypothetical protein [unclassified Methylobacterium]TXN41420.1 hypothetical protein FV225_02730 [Methylobacterium sp. WL93]TXN49802.1 hypothetical protein FV227_15020 [Methylobacterium sp. WL119]TXN62770.1 hypothetical protein FV232_24745 [Methylobacterium sp. WL30]
MKHACIPDFSTYLPSRTPIAHPTPADPIHAAIQRHCAALDNYRTAPSLITNNEVDAAFDALVVTACASRVGAMALLAHLRTFLTEEADFADGWWPSFQMAHARAADLQLLLGGGMPPTAIPPAFPSGRMVPAAVVHMQAPQPMPLHLHVIHGVGAANELISAIAIFGASAWLVGLATTL